MREFHYTSLPMRLTYTPRCKALPKCTNKTNRLVEEIGLKDTAVVGGANGVWEWFVLDS